MYLTFNVLDHPSFNFVSFYQKNMFFVRIKPLEKENQWPGIWETLLILSSRQVLQTQDVWWVMEQLKETRLMKKKCNVILICPLLHKVHLNDNCLLDCIYTSAVILMAMRVLFLSELHLYCLCNKQYIDIFVAFVSLHEYKIGCLKKKRSEIVREMPFSDFHPWFYLKFGAHGILLGE